MALQNRVDPFGELIATPARGLLLGNRGGRFHRDDQTLGARRWASRQWICCVLSFKQRRRQVWGHGYTELFFLDEVTALAAGHRPCFECRLADAKVFATKWAEGKKSDIPYAPEMDLVLQNERLDGRVKRTHAMPIDDLPDGTVLDVDGNAFAIRDSHLLHWSERGYVGMVARPTGIEARILTPPSIVGVLRAGYRPQWHPSADLHLALSPFSDKPPTARATAHLL